MVIYDRRLAVVIIRASMAGFDNQNTAIKGGEIKNELRLIRNRAGGDLKHFCNK